MSSPGASLGRVRRAPLPGLPSPGRRVVPFKAGAYTDEALLLNDVLLPRYKVPGEATSTQEYDTKRSVMGGAPNDLELMATMMHKLGLLEQRVKSQAQELHQKDRTISTLEEKVNILKKQAKEGSSEPSRVLELEKRCLELQNRVWEMEGFLNDYGMVWVGDKETESNGESAEGEMPEQKAQQPQGLWKPGHSTPSSFLVDFDVILENVKDLNALAGEGEARIEHTEGGARLRQPDPIPLTLYQNGIILFRGPFRSYQEPSTQRCVQDIMDGYFPSELQSRFPDGIPFQVTDRRTVTFRETQRWDTFPGQGQVVGGPLSGGDSTLETSEAPGPKLSLDQFLNKLPRAVVKGGQVLDIRGPIQEHLQGSGRTKDSAVILVETPALTALQERLKVEPQNRPPSAQNLTTLRVKSERGDQTYIMKMLFTETIEDLRTHLAAHRGPETSSYDIISTFPQQVYHDGTKTLKECGLIPNATLHLQAKKF